MGCGTIVVERLRHDVHSNAATLSLLSPQLNSGALGGDKLPAEISGIPMTIADPNTIDLLATKPGSSEVQLIVTDHLDWDDVAAHCRLLQDKLNSYIGFIESGEA